MNHLGQGSNWIFKAHPLQVALQNFFRSCRTCCIHHWMPSGMTNALPVRPCSISKRWTSMLGAPSGGGFMEVSSSWGCTRFSDNTNLEECIYIYIYSMYIYIYSTYINILFFTYIYIYYILNICYIYSQYICTIYIYYFVLHFIFILYYIYIIIYILFV